jgi:hypothetical protein
MVWATPGVSRFVRHFLRKTIRVRKEDSAYVYFILESYEGIVSYSTLEHRVGAAYRDLELRIPPDFTREVEELLEAWKDLVVVLEPQPTETTS